MTRISANSTDEIEGDFDRKKSFKVLKPRFIPSSYAVVFTMIAVVLAKTSQEYNEEASALPKVTEFEEQKISTDGQEEGKASIVWVDIIGDKETPRGDAKVVDIKGKLASDITITHSSELVAGKKASQLYSSSAFIGSASFVAGAAALISLAIAIVSGEKKTVQRDPLNKLDDELVSKNNKSFASLYMERKEQNDSKAQERA